MTAALNAAVARENALLAATREYAASAVTTDWRTRCVNREPFIDPYGQTWIALRELAKFAGRSPLDTWALLTWRGWENRQMSVRLNGKVYGRCVWGNANAR